MAAVAVGCRKGLVNARQARRAIVGGEKKRLVSTFLCMHVIIHC